MTDDIARRFGSLRSRAPFFSLRLHDESREILSVRQDAIEPPSLSASRGAMLTAVVEGGSGYCATGDLSVDGLQEALDRATHWAEATRGRSVEGFSPARMASSTGRYESPGSREEIDRRAVLELLRAECAAAKTDARIVERHAGLEVIDDARRTLTSEGGDLVQRLRFTLPRMRVTASDDDDTQSRSFELMQQGGVEQIGRSGIVGAGTRLADEALRLLTAPECPSGAMELLLMPDQMMLQIHESIGHPLELDRILGDERNYAGASFVTPAMFGNYRYGSELLNVTFDPGRPEELAAFGWDDEGEAASRRWLIRDGLLVAPLGGRLSQARAGNFADPVASSRASSWNRPPIDRMANLNVEPGASTLDSMIASVERGVLMRTNVSWSIDDSRNKFQFGCEWGELIENGRVAGVVKNPNYRGVSATFWRSLRAVGDRSTFELHGTLYCGKGEPNQVVACGHAAPACLFAGVDVFGGEA